MQCGALQGACLARLGRHDMGGWMHAREIVRVDDRDRLAAGLRALAALDVASRNQALDIANAGVQASGRFGLRGPMVVLSHGLQDFSAVGTDPALAEGWAICS